MAAGVFWQKATTKNWLFFRCRWFKIKKKKKIGVAATGAECVDIVLSKINSYISEKPTFYLFHRPSISGGLWTAVLVSRMGDCLFRIKSAPIAIASKLLIWETHFSNLFIWLIWWTITYHKIYDWHMVTSNNKQYNDAVSAYQDKISAYNRK